MEKERYETLSGGGAATIGINLTQLLHVFVLWEEVTEKNGGVERNSGLSCCEATLPNTAPNTYLLAKITALIL